eukprot:scaffold138767_cov416-Phaeocystis_antarctica.AAC.1
MRHIHHIHSNHRIHYTFRQAPGAKRGGAAAAAAAPAAARRKTKEKEEEVRQAGATAVPPDCPSTHHSIHCTVIHCTVSCAIHRAVSIAISMRPLWRHPLRHIHCTPYPLHSIRWHILSCRTHCAYPCAVIHCGVIHCG